MKPTEDQTLLPARKARRHPAWHMARIVLGWAFIVLGIIGCFLPFLQGILFLAIGAGLLAPYVPFFRKLQTSLYKRFPGARNFLKRTKQKLRASAHSPHSKSEENGKNQPE